MLRLLSELGVALSIIFGGTMRAAAFSVEAGGVSILLVELGRFACGVRFLPLWLCPSERTWGRTKSWLSSGLVEWARCIVPEIPGWGAT
jgi:hypothetical protein